MSENKLCPHCNQPNTGWKWCQNCNSKRFQQSFDKWTSGNELIDNFIQEAQLKARDDEHVIEWISYNRFRNIQYLAQGGFSTVYKAIWLDGYIYDWDIENQQWMRYFSKLKDEDYKIAKQGNVKSPLNESEKYGWHVVLKSLNNSSNIHEDFLNEWKNYLKFVQASSAVNFYGITQDPETSNYMAVMFYIEFGNLRSNLTVQKYNPNDKYGNLYHVVLSLSELHKCNLVHGDLHSGNILLSDDHNPAYISDFGLSKPADKPTKSKEIYGVLPYIAPEVLRGKPYTKAADVYSFGIIMWEMTSGIPAFNNVPHDFDLSLEICKGLRPKIVEGTEIEYVKLMERCWNSDPEKRPTAEELSESFNKWKQIFPYNYYKRISVPENEPIIQNHPLSCYTSKRIDYSAKLNEILSQNELSSKIIIDNKKDGEDNYTMLSGDLEHYKISSSKIDSTELNQETKNEEEEFDEYLI